MYVRNPVLVMFQGQASCVKGSLVEHATWQEWLNPSATSWLWSTAQLCCLLERHGRSTHIPNCVVLKLSIWAGKFCWFGTFKLYTCLPSSWGCLNVQVVAALALHFYKYSMIVLFFLCPMSRKTKTSILKIIIFRRTVQYLCYRDTHKLGWLEVCLAPGLWDRGQTWHVSRWQIVRVLCQTTLLKF